MNYVNFGATRVSRFILGSNPFSGFSHQGTARDAEMKRYFTAASIKDTIRAAEALGVNTLIARTDFHVMRLLLEYGDEGGTIQWFAQTCPEVGDSIACVNRAASGGAKACHIHGGVMDHLVAHGRGDEVIPAIDKIRSLGMLAGIAGHNTSVFKWALEHLDVDYYMCSYYNPIRRDLNPEHVSGTAERYLDEDRAAMTDFLQRLPKPVIHYKVMAAGRNNPAEALTFAATKMRANDATCIGLYPKDKPSMLQENVELLNSLLKA